MYYLTKNANRLVSISFRAPIKPISFAPSLVSVCNFFFPPIPIEVDVVIFLVRICFAQYVFIRWLFAPNQYRINYLRLFLRMRKYRFSNQINGNVNIFSIYFGQRRNTSNDKILNTHTHTPNASANFSRDTGI